MTKEILGAGNNPIDQGMTVPNNLQEEVRLAGFLVGLDGLEVVISPGAGWSCAVTKHGMTITADPYQLAERRAISGPDASPVAAEELKDTPINPKTEHIIHTIFHELGHATDYMDPAWTKMSNNKADAFFYNIIDDSAVDSRNRKIPLVNDANESIYKNVLFPEDDLTGVPRHIQLMYAVLLKTVTPDRQLIINGDVTTVIEKLQNIKKNSQSHNLFTILADPRTTLKQRNFVAKNLIKPYYDTLLDQDKKDAQDANGDSGEEQFEIAYSAYDLAAHGQSHDDQTASTGQDDAPKISKDLASQLIEALKELQDSQKESTETNNQSQIKKEGENEDSSTQLQLSALAQEIAGEMNLNQANAMMYANSVIKWQDTIRAISNVFLKLAGPTNTIRSPRYRHGPSIDGLRLHPSTLAVAALQLEMNTEQSIWQKVERKACRQDVAFGGIDIHLLVDVSGSMRSGEKAQCAADTALCLIEGLQLAKHKVSNINGQFHQPDVRTQIVAFGSETATLSAISPQSTNEQKSKTYVNLLDPNSGSTLVAGALEQVRDIASLTPNRESLVIIISDGDFHDHYKAAQLIASMPDNCSVSQLVIGNDVKQYITNEHKNISNPSILPGELLKILSRHIA